MELEPTSNCERAIMAIEVDSYGVPKDWHQATLSDLVSAVGRWGKDRGIVANSSSMAQLAKLIEEVGELASGVAKRKPDVIRDSIGDAMVVLVMLASIEGVTVRDCLFAAWNEIRDRKGRMNDEGVFVKEADEAK